MKFRPLHDRVVVKRIDAEEKTAGGIIIPDSAKEKPSQGEVVSVGPGGRDEAGKPIPLDVKVGDRVLFGKWSGTDVKPEGERSTYLLDDVEHEKRSPFVRWGRRRNAGHGGYHEFKTRGSPAEARNASILLKPSKQRIVRPSE